MNKGERTSFLGSQQVSLPHLYKLNHTNQGLKVIFGRLDRAPVRLQHEAFLYYNKEKLKQSMDKFEEGLIKDKLLACEIVNNGKAYVNFIAKNEEAKSLITDVSSNYYNFQNATIKDSLTSIVQFEKEMKAINTLFLDYVNRRKIELRQNWKKKKREADRSNNSTNRSHEEERQMGYLKINTSYVKTDKDAQRHFLNKEHGKNSVRLKLNLPSRHHDKISTDCSFTDNSSNLININSSMFFHSSIRSEGNFPQLQKSRNEQDLSKTARNPKVKPIDLRKICRGSTTKLQGDGQYLGFLSDRAHSKQKRPIQIS